MKPVDIQPAKGKLGILLVGLGAVSTTVIAGVLAVRKNLAKPIGSLTQMGTLRLGKRTDGRSPKIADVLPIAGLDDVVFGGWDLFDDNCYEAAKTAGVLERLAARQIRPELEALKPWPAVFDRQYVKRLDGPNVKKGKNKLDLAEQVIADIRKFKADHAARSARDGVVRQHRDLHERVAGASVDRRVREGARRKRRRRSRRAWSTPTRR